MREERTREESTRKVRSKSWLVDYLVIYLASCPNKMTLTVLGQGTYGKVFVHSPRRAHKHFAKSKTLVLPQYVVRQVAILKHLKAHPLILGLCSRKVTLNPKSPVLPSQLMSTDLGSYVLKHSLSHSILERFVRQIIDATAYVNSQGIAHRDIKPANILVNKRGNGIRLGDWDLATTIWARVDNAACTSEVVSLGYRPPEMLLGYAYPSSSELFLIDAFSVGCVILYMLTRTHIFTGNNEIDSLWRIYKVMGTPAPDSWLMTLCQHNPQGPVYKAGCLPATVIEPYRTLVTQLLQIEPARRSTCGQLNGSRVYPPPAPTPRPTNTMPRTRAQLDLFAACSEQGGLSSRTLEQANMYIDRLAGSLQLGDIDLAVCCLVIASQMYEYNETTPEDIMLTYLGDISLDPGTSYMRVVEALNYELVHVY
jgi:serine/threonine protein kinase